MTEEILDKLKYIVDFPIIEHDTSFNSDNVEESVCLLISNECQLLLDYITNLQQENGNLKTNEQINVEVHNKQLEIIKDYKSRCEKANDFIDNYDVFKEFSFPLMKRDIENQIKSSIDYEFNSTFRKKLKNILNGSDDK